MGCLVRILAIALAFASGAALADDPRIALVIGNSEYRSAPLPNPVNDAHLMTSTLRALGFHVIERTDADQETMKRAIQEFGERLESAGPSAMGLFFYAGHGVQLNGRNYLIPTSAVINREGDMEIEAVSADWVLAQMRYARNRLNLVILDACRNNPFARGLRSAGRGLAKMDAPAGTLIAYSTAPGDVAEDGDGHNSPYTESLARSMLEVAEPVEQVFKRARVAVMETTVGRQIPWESSSLTGDFFFVEPVEEAESSASSAPVDSAGQPSGADQAIEIAFWQSLQGSQSIAEYQAYLNRYPNGSFAPLANNRIRELQSSVTRIPGSADACGSIAGRWKVTVNQIAVEGEVVVRPDQVLEWWKSPSDKLPAVSGTWTCEAAQRRFVFSWGHGGVDTLTLAADGRSLSGANQFGMRIYNTRLQ